jgi:predicted phage terminase large subunit-like protein
MYCGIDPASSLSRRADFFVIATIAVDGNNRKYFIDCVQKRISPAEQPGEIIRVYKKYKPKRMKIETVGYQEALRTATRQLMQEQNLYIPGLEKGVKPRNAKSERLLSLVPMFAKGDFFFRPEDINAQQEFLSYPKGKHDDIMDATWTALDGHRACRLKEYVPTDGKSNLIKKFLDWKLM